MLASVAAFATPRQAEARSSLGANLSYYHSSSNLGSNSTSSSQEKASFLYSFMTTPSRKLTLDSKINLDVLMKKSGASDSFELQPKISMNLINPLVRFGVGYRTIYRDNTVVTGNTTKDQHTDSYDLFGDLGLRMGILPEMRARYSLRGNATDDSVNGKTSDGTTNELRLSVNDNIFGIAINADYMLQDTKDKILDSTLKLRQLSFQASYDIKLGKKLKLGLRHDMFVNKTESKGGVDERTEDQTVNTSQAKAVMNPVKRSSVVVNYLYKTEKNDTTSTVDPSTSYRSTDKRLTVSAAYSFPKYLKFRGTYTNRNFENPNSINESKNYIGVVDFQHNIRKITMKAHYEKWVQQSTTESKFSGNQNDSEQSRDKLNLVLGYVFSPALRFSVTEAYQKTDKNGETTENTRYRFAIEAGPWHGLRFKPYLDRVQNVNAAGKKSTSTDIVAQVSYMKKIHEKLSFDFTDNYRKSMSESGGNTRETESNNATIRLNMTNVFNNVNMGIDATYSTNKSKSQSSDSTSINYRMGWYKIPHRVSLNLGYRTGSNTTDSYSLAASYGISLQLRKLSLSLMANYLYLQTMSTPVSSSQSMIVTLTIRK